MCTQASLLLVLGLLAAAPALASEPALEHSSATEPRTNTSDPRKLDLRLPDIRTIFSSETLDRILSRARDPDAIEEIEVERARERVPSSPAIPGGLAAPFWAIVNPTQAWRIFAPIPPDRALLLASAPDATATYRPLPSPRGIAIDDY
jgi:hypothetical protein